MITIFKYQFPIQDEFTLELPLFFEVVLVDAQNRTPCIWAKVDTEAAKTAVKFRVFGTGHPMPRDVPLVHVGSFQCSPFVWHLFMEGDQ